MQSSPFEKSSRFLGLQKSQLSKSHQRDDPSSLQSQNLAIQTNQILKSEIKRRNSSIALANATIENSFFVSTITDNSFGFNTSRLVTPRKRESSLGNQRSVVSLNQHNPALQLHTELSINEIPRAKDCQNYFKTTENQLQQKPTEREYKNNDTKREGQKDLKRKIQKLLEKDKDEENYNYNSENRSINPSQFATLFVPPLPLQSQLQPASILVPPLKLNSIISTQGIQQQQQQLNTQTNRSCNFQIMNKTVNLNNTQLLISPYSQTAPSVTLQQQVTVIPQNNNFNFMNKSLPASNNSNNNNNYHQVTFEPQPELFEGQQQQFQLPQPFNNILISSPLIHPQYHSPKVEQHTQKSEYEERQQIEVLDFKRTNGNLNIIQDEVQIRNELQNPIQEKFQLSAGTKNNLNQQLYQSTPSLFSGSNLHYQSQYHIQNYNKAAQIISTEANKTIKEEQNYQFNYHINSNRMSPSTIEYQNQIEVIPLTSQYQQNMPLPINNNNGTLQFSHSLNHIQQIQQIPLRNIDKQNIQSIQKNQKNEEGEDLEGSLLEGSNLLPLPQSIQLFSKKIGVNGQDEYKIQQRGEQINSEDNDNLTNIQKKLQQHPQILQYQHKSPITSSDINIQQQSNFIKNSQADTNFSSPFFFTNNYMIGEGTSQQQKQQVSHNIHMKMVAQKLESKDIPSQNNSIQSIMSQYLGETQTLDEQSRKKQDQLQDNCVSKETNVKGEFDPSVSISSPILGILSKKQHDAVSYNNNSSLDSATKTQNISTQVNSPSTSQSTLPFNSLLNSNDIKIIPSQKRVNTQTKTGTSAIKSILTPLTNKFKDMINYENSNILGDQKQSSFKKNFSSLSKYRYNSHRTPRQEEECLSAIQQEEEKKKMTESYSRKTNKQSTQPTPIKCKPLFSPDRFIQNNYQTNELSKYNPAIQYKTNDKQNGNTATKRLGINKDPVNKTTLDDPSTISKIVSYNNVSARNTPKAVSPPPTNYLKTNQSSNPNSCSKIPLKNSPLYSRNQDSSAQMQVLRAPDVTDQKKTKTTIWFPNRSIQNSHDHEKRQLLSLQTSPNSSRNNEDQTSLFYKPHLQIQQISPTISHLAFSAQHLSLPQSNRQQDQNYSTINTYPYSPSLQQSLPSPQTSIQQLNQQEGDCLEEKQDTSKTQEETYFSDNQPKHITISLKKQQEQSNSYPASNILLHNDLAAQAKSQNFPMNSIQFSSLNYRSQPFLKNIEKRTNVYNPQYTTARPQLKNLYK